ncbi:MAG: sodium:solute symporter family protein, partial [Candidatus Glassbacteria bacterium]|nr:sodium:solute symporter family protein [Candidatus Glassbacteria bacterium]
VPVEQGIVITAVFVVGYTVLAGMISVVYTDVVNGIIMIVGLFTALPFLLKTAGGWGAVVEALPGTHFQVFGEMSAVEALGYSFATMLLLLGEAGMYQRFFSARDETAARRSVIGLVASTVVIETLIVALAVIGSALFPGIDPEMVILSVVAKGLPAAVGCLCLAAIVAVIVSTADSFLLVPATSAMRDIYQRFINPEASPRRFLVYSRLAVVLLGMIAYLQVQFFTRVLEMAVYAYTMYGVGVTPALLAAFFWKRATPAGGVSSIAAGMAVTVLWEVLKKPGDIPTVYPALGASLFCLAAVSLLTVRPAPAKLEIFFGRE